MARDQEERERVKRAYVHQRQSIEQAAQTAGVPLGTARRWKGDALAKGDDWDRARAAASLSSAGVGAVAQAVLADFLLLHQGAMEAVRTDTAISALERAEALSRLADAFTKTMAAVAKAAPELGRYAVATELLQDFARFVLANFPQHAEALMEVLEPFGQDVAARYG